MNHKGLRGITTAALIGVLSACGGGGSDAETPPEPEMMSANGGSEGGGNGGANGGANGGGANGGAGPGNGGGEGDGAGQCRFAIELLADLTGPGTPPESKQLVIRTKCGSGQPFMPTFTTNNGDRFEESDGIGSVECGNPEFLVFYQDRFDVVNQDCLL